MRIRLQEIDQEPFEWQERLSIPAADLEREGLLELSEIGCQGVLEHEAPGFRLEARLNYEQTLACTRCLEPIVEPIVSGVELKIEVRAAEPTAGEYELEESDLRVIYLGENVVDTRPIVLEQIDLSIPMKPLCRENCAGLCPVCGGNRNLQLCECEEKTVDSRWEVLKGLDAIDDDQDAG